MVKFIIKRILLSIPIFIVLTFAVFLLSNMAPGSPVDVIAAETDLSPEAYAALEHSLGLDKPLVVRYALWLGNMLRGDMGLSSRTQTSVWEMIAARLVPSLMLTMTGMIIAIIISIPLGVLAAYKPYCIWDNISSAISFLGTSTPGFLICLCGIYFFCVKLNILPSQGMYTVGAEKSFGDLMRHLLMPACIVAFQLMGNLIKQTRSNVLEVLNENYIKTARSKGIRENTVIIRHALRNALIPIITVISLNIPFLIGGTVVVEKIFGWPGIGSLLTDSINYKDYNPIMGVAVVICIVVLISNILLDILYSVLDPRIGRK
ncbi:MAG: ABC transporter permease [Oscillospiraceae bacterium]